MLEILEDLKGLIDIHSPKIHVRKTQFFYPDKSRNNNETKNGRSEEKREISTREQEEILASL